MSSKPPLWLLTHRGDRKRAIQFLVELVNCPLVEETIPGFAAEFREFCPRPLAFPDPTLRILQDLLQDVWKAVTPVERKLRLNGLLTYLSGVLPQVLPQKANEQPEFADIWGNITWAIWQAVDVSDWMRICLNPGCRSRYFVAQRRTQKYCSKKCAEPSHREIRLRWWNKYGAARRAARKKAGKGQTRKKKSQIRGGK
jgi:hypothetical protein